jgi:hypothetical protein
MALTTQDNQERNNGPKETLPEMAQPKRETKQPTAAVVSAFLNWYSRSGMEFHFLPNAVACWLAGWLFNLLFVSQGLLKQ